MSEQQSAVSTKVKIFNAAVQLFSDNGYKEVSMRDIAKVVGINVSSLYNHFNSKEDILLSLYEYYSARWQEACPDINALLLEVETTPPHELLMKLNFHFDPAIEETMSRIVRIAVRQIRMDNNSENFIDEFVRRGSVEQLLNRMIELNRIEPINVKALTCLLANYSASAAFFNGTSLQVEREDWHAGLEMAFSLIKPK
ncbi:MAG: TetR/AcrR family transcriptional regulator [Oscillospiraceae bacterium]|nr:TetR/AcrR family transcriptional regulator [Oscillospiraceae bacterium]